ncbi:MAG: hypothetical protein WD894_13745 [Pirellulales bacterium]
MHPLRDQIARLRRQIRRLVVAYGLSALMIGVLGCVLLLGFTDYLIRFEDRGVRILSTLALVGVTAWVFYRYLWPVLSLRLSDVAIARRVERRFPELADRLSSAIDFLDQPEDEPTAGSAELRRAVVVQTTADVETLRWSAALDSRPAVRTCAIAIALSLVAILLVALRPRAALVALQRLAMPWSDTAWPRTYHLAFKNPVTRVAIGQDFEVELIDHNGTPPEDARIVYRYPVEGQFAEEEQDKFVKLGGALVARKESVVRPFEYRAIGGDDETMDWIKVEVVEPPAVESIAMTLYPPEYSGWPRVTSERRIEALRGTRVALAGRTTRPIATAAVRQDDSPAVPLRVIQNGLGFALVASDPDAWVIDKSGKYWIELGDRDLLVGGSDDRWDIRAIADEPPRVTFERPIGTLYVTASAVVPIRLAVHDDLAIHRVLLHYLRSDQSDAGEQTVELQAGPDRAPPPPADHQVLDNRGESREIGHDWDLGPLGLSPGVQLTMTASAADYRPQTGVSQAVRIAVLTPREFEDRITVRQSGILAEIARVLKMQQETRAATQALLTQATRVGELRKQDADGAHTAELSQRQIRRSLASPSEGVLAQTTALLDELTANRLDNPEMVRRVEQIQDEIRRLNAAELATVEQELVAVVKNSQLVLQEESGDAKEIVARMAGSLSTAVGAQDGVIAALEKLLDELAEWTDYRAIARDVAEIQSEQATLRQRTETIQPATLGRDYESLTAQQQADLQTLTGVQAELARRFDKLQQRMEQMQQKFRDTVPLAAVSLADAIELARRQAIGSDMRDSARFVAGNRLGQSLDRQQAIDAKLDELLDILSSRREQELSRLVKKLRAAEEELAALRQQQQGLRKRIRQTHEQLQATADVTEQDEKRNELARLMREQQKLAEEIERLGRELQRLRAEEAAQQMTAAGDKMQRGSQAGEQGESAKSADLADEAQQQLDEAQRELAARRRQAEQDLANEQLATVEHALVGLASRQEGALAETRRLAGLRDPSGNLRPEQTQSLKDLARNQAQLKDEADAVAEKVSAAEVFQLGVRSASDQMHRAAERLAAGDTSDDVQRAEQQALLRLRQLLTALKEGQNIAAGDPNQNQNQDGGKQPDNAGQQPKPKPIVHSVTEIKLLTVMQEDVNRRTIELQGHIAGRAANEAEAGELAALAQEQGRIAALVAKMTARAAAERDGESGKGEEAEIGREPN